MNSQKSNIAAIAGRENDTESTIKVSAPCHTPTVRRSRAFFDAYFNNKQIISNIDSGALHAFVLNRTTPAFDLIITETLDALVELRNSQQIPVYGTVQAKF